MQVTKSEKMNVRDYITTAIMLVLIFVVFVLIGTPIGMTVVGNIFPLAVCSILWGTIFLLLFTKVSKRGVVLLVGLILAALQLANFWAIATVMSVGAVLAEFLWRKLDRKKLSTMIICFTTLIIFWFLGIFLPLIFLKDMYIAALPTYEQLYTGVYDMIIGPMFFVGFAATITGCVVGALLGKLLLKKHFVKAGII